MVAMISATIKTSNSGDYHPDYIEHLAGNFTPERLIQRAKWTDFYVVCKKGSIIGCGAIGSRGGQQEESHIYNVYVSPREQRQGIGRSIIQTLEQSEYFLRSTRVEVISSVTAVGFYLKLGYELKGKMNATEKDKLYILEKKKSSSLEPVGKKLQYSRKNLINL